MSGQEGASALTRDTRTIVGVTAAGIMALVFLTACAAGAEPTSANPESTRSPMPSATAAPEPASEADAIAAGYAAAQEYFRIWDEILNEHPEDTSSIDAIAYEAAEDAVVRDAASYADKRYTSEGNVTFTLLEGQSYAAPALSNGVTESEYGQPILYGCVDYREARAYDEDGKAFPPPNPSAIKVEVIARYLKAEQRWVITGYQQDLESTECTL